MKGRQSLDAFHLKVIAIIAMFINHIGHTFEMIWNPPFWEFIYLTIGMLTYPIMAYLVVEGFHYTRNRWKYAGRLGLFSVLSFYPFAFVFSFVLWPGNNIMFTLMMGIFLMMLCEKFPDFIVQAILVVAFVMLTIVSDWNLFGIPLLYAFYKTHGKPKANKYILIATSLLMATISVFLSGGFVNWTAVIASSLGLLLAIPLLNAYNGQRGYSPMWVKWGFYAFYPAHIWVLWGGRLLFFGY